MPSLLRRILTTKRLALESLAGLCLLHTKLLGAAFFLLGGIIAMFNAPDTALLKALQQQHQRVTNYRPTVCRAWPFEDSTTSLLQAYSLHMLDFARRENLTVLSSNELGIEHCFLVINSSFLINPTAQYSGTPSNFAVRFPNLCKNASQTLRLYPKLSLRWIMLNNQAQNHDFSSEEALRVQIQLALMSGLDACKSL